MPLVSEDFVKNAEALAKSVPELQNKLVAAEKNASEAPNQENLVPLAEATADTLITAGLIPAAEKSAAVSSLLNHEQALQALNKTAGYVKPTEMGAGAVEKTASMGSGYGPSIRGDESKESDRMLLSRLGF